MAYRIDGPAVRINFQHRVWSGGGAAAQVEGEDWAPDGGLVGFARLLDLAARYADGDGRGDPGATGDAAVEEVAHDAEAGFGGEVVVLGIELIAEEGDELARVKGSDFRLVAGCARQEGEGDAFGAEEDGGAVRAAEESLEFRRSGIALVAVFCHADNFLSLGAN